MSTIRTAGNATTNGASITSAADGIIEIKTGTGAGTAAISIDASQNVSAAANLTVTGNSFVVSGSSVIGYGTGAGGTVTQLTNKGTSVTLNKPTGQITMNNAALAASAIISFSVNNSLITTSDTVLINISGGISSYVSYRAWALIRSAGVFEVVLENRSSGSLSEAVVINFAIINGVTA